MKKLQNLALALWLTLTGCSTGCNTDSSSKIPKLDSSTTDAPADFYVADASRDRDTPDAGILDGYINDCKGEVPPLNTSQTGVCVGSVQSCLGGKWVDSYEKIKGYELSEVSCDALDNDCDGLVDNNLIPPSRECRVGIGECERTGLEYRICEGLTGWSTNYENCDVTVGEPSEEICDRLDNNCNGLVDELLGPTIDWTVNYGLVRGFNGGTGVTTDRDGNVYVIGRVANLEQGLDIWINKYDTTGNQLWENPITYNGFANRNDEGTGIAVVGEGNIYVTGYESVLDQDSNIWVNKYDAAGNQLWVNPITYNNSLTSRFDEGRGIAVDSEENIYVTGYESVTGQVRNIWINKYDPAGNQLWTDPMTYSGPAAAESSLDQGQGIAVDSERNIYVTGYESVTDQNQNIWINKYDSAGNQLWANPVTYNGATNGDDKGRGIVVDSEGNIYVTGHESVAEQDRDIWINKYDSAGNQLWANPITYNGLANRNDTGKGITVDSEGNIYVTGSESATSQGRDIWINKYDPTGNQLWVDPLTYNSGGENDEGRGIVVDSEGNFYVTGHQSSTGDATTIWLRKYICNN